MNTKYNFFLDKFSLINNLNLLKIQVMKQIEYNFLKF